jgi:hypothetical protein
VLPKQKLAAGKTLEILKTYFERNLGSCLKNTAFSQIMFNHCSNAFHAQNCIKTLNAAFLVS